MENNIQIAGFTAHIKNVSMVLSWTRKIAGQGTIQLLRAQRVAGEKHLLHATYQALLAFQRRENISPDLGMEICLRASAQRQISRAIQLLGIAEGKQRVAAVLVDCPEALPKLESMLGPQDTRALEFDPERLKAIYKISDQEVYAYKNVKKVLIERIALLNLEK
ncbi:MAG TPA: KEOPS complex subunit Cgi121 [Methanobacteriaceae archaeon]|mgnify:CR=1 FL=1|nr:KEOPS complex subunit Cgi121 [Methanobacteriaceae archaeon]HNS25306.1 KEOPS complex subunit Cgi121 [Methanobacteriaceae archaeon]